ncbi:Lrp/AsnC family transcriptional regulator [Bradyrhizobium sp. Arg237L]|uniref:Lrp/AsnC family transcriptional regulator n=1 Tax=Bradyrhizobium sp. Arg237L TaxID=3003352 RepID=UPI00249F28CB|nr:Lrp/AsnC family transcriptional regulator [Bradyrhizobium sp. Arg237L]MDI4234136.1 Lrp/AsnC family transcriptional regulator [Bradyrhizobium sp. Arg237L]
MAGVDQIDRNIVRLLRLNARMTNAKLAEEVGLSPSSCLRRIRQLEQNGTIRGYTALVGQSSPEGTLAVIINISLERQTEDYLSKFEGAIRKNPEIQECYLMTGAADYLLRIEVDNAAEFERIHTEILSTLPGVARIHSSFAIRNVLTARKRPALNNSRPQREQGETRSSCRRR